MMLDYTSQPLFVWVTGPEGQEGQYGLSVQDCQGNCLFCCGQLTGDHNRVLLLAGLLEEQDIAPAHIADIAEDFLY